MIETWSIKLKTRERDHPHSGVNSIMQSHYKNQVTRKHEGKSPTCVSHPSSAHRIALSPAISFLAILSKFLCAHILLFSSLFTQKLAYHINTVLTLLFSRNTVSWQSLHTHSYRFSTFFFTAAYSIVRMNHNLFN